MNEWCGKIRKEGYGLDRQIRSECFSSDSKAKYEKILHLILYKKNQMSFILFTFPFSSNLLVHHFIKHFIHHIICMYFTLIYFFNTLHSTKITVTSPSLHQQPSSGRRRKWRGHWRRLPRRGTRMCVGCWPRRSSSPARLSPGYTPARPTSTLSRCRWRRSSVWLFSYCMFGLPDNLLTWSYFLCWFWRVA